MSDHSHIHPQLELGESLLQLNIVYLQKQAQRSVGNKPVTPEGGGRFCFLCRMRNLNVSCDFEGNYELAQVRFWICGANLADGVHVVDICVPIEQCSNLELFGASNSPSVPLRSRHGI